MKRKNRRPAVTAKEPQPAEPPRAPAPVPVDWRAHGWRVLSVWLVALAAYSSSFRSGLVLDNLILIGQDPRIRAFTPQNLHLILTEELWYHTAISGLYRPLSTFSYLVNYALLGNSTNPTGYHWVNFGLHALNILLVYALGLIVLDEAAWAWALAAFWGLHPLLTESVTNIIGRADLLAGFGVLGGVFCHVQAARSAGRRKLAWLAGLTAAAAIGIFSKESAAVLPGIMLLYDLTWRGSAPWKHRWTGYACLLLPFAIFFKLRADVLARQFAVVFPFLDNPLTGADFFTARLTACKVIGKYLWLFVWPSRFSTDYSYNAVPLFGWHLFNWPDIAAVLALLVCVAGVIAAIYLYPRSKPGFLFILFFFIALAPVSNIVILIGSIMAERFLYLPAVGLAGCLVVGIRFGVRRLSIGWPACPRWARAVMILLCGALAARTFARNLDWSDEIKLGISDVATVPRSFKAHELLAAARINASPPELDGAVNEIERTLQILDGVPDDELLARPFQVAGLIFRKKGDSLEPNGGALPAPGGPGASWYRKALAALLRGEQADRAEKEKIRQPNLDTQNNSDDSIWPPLYLELGRVYRRLGEPQKSLEVLQYARSHRPDDEFSEELSITRLAMGDTEQAVVALMEGLVLNPNSPKLPAALARLYSQTARDTCALDSSRGNSINLGCPLVHRQLCDASRNVGLAYARNGQPAKAAATARSAIQDLGCPAQLFQ